MTAAFPTKVNCTFLALLLAVATTAAVAQDHPRRNGPPQDQQPASGHSVLELLPADAVTQHTIETTTGKLDYTATAGTLALYNQSGEKSAAIFYTAYVAKGADAAKRPLTFVFNGGPGAASAYLHLGLVGPRIADFGPTSRDAASLTLQDNPNTWLAF